MAGMGQDLVVNLAGNNAKLKKSLVEGKSSLTDFSTAATTLLNPVGIAFAGIAASAAAAGLSMYGIGERIETLAKVVDKANQTGLSAKFIQDLGFAADQSGVPVENFLDSLKDMTNNLGKAELAGEKTATNFEQIGLNIQDLKLLRPEDQFLAIADAISKLPSVAEKAAAGSAIFGESAVKMVPLLSQGEEGIRSLMAEADKLKISISDEDLQSIATADNAMQRMKSSLSSVISKIAVGMAPLFESISNTVTTITPQIGEIAKAMSSGLADAINIAVKLFNDDLLPGIRAFLTTSGDLLTKWSEMPDKFSFAGEIIQAVFDVAFEYIKVYWSIMLDDMIAATADAAMKMLNMLNPKTGFNAVADWLLGQDTAKADPKNELAALEAAQARLDALVTRLQTGGELQPPDSGVKQPAVNNVPAIQPAAATGPISAAGVFMGGGGAVAPGGKDPNVKATEEQTAALLEGLRRTNQFPVSVVPSF